MRFEKNYFHWVTNRALREMVRKGIIKSEQRALATGTHITLMWDRRYRYPKRQADEVVKLVDEYSQPSFVQALGRHGEGMILEGFARRQFLTVGRSIRTYGSKTWTQTAHNLDFIFERDGVAYGVEVKNTLPYMDEGELWTKLQICDSIDVRPVIAARWLPRTWVRRIIDGGGYAFLMRYQLYPWGHEDLARRVRDRFGLPVDCPKALYDRTMDRFENWHLKNVI